VQELTPEEMAVWSNMVALGQCDLETMWSVFEAGDKTPANFDFKKLETAIEKEQQAKQEREIETQTALARNFDRGGPAEE
jgi:hypothetical protein